VSGSVSSRGNDAYKGPSQWDTAPTRARFKESYEKEKESRTVISMLLLDGEGVLAQRCPPWVATVEHFAPQLINEPIRMAVMSW
jgi:hypothetical protein